MSAAVLSELRLRPADHTPLYLQIEEQIKRLITEQGSLKPNTKIPAVHRLARDLGVSVTTVEKALSDLIRDGFLYSKIGCGTYVASMKTVRVRRIGVTCYGLGSEVPLTIEHAPTFFNLFAGLSETVLGGGFHTFLLARSGDAITADDIGSLGLSGVAFLSRIPSVDLVRNLKDRGFPYICVGNEPVWKQEDLNRVTSHSYTAASELIQDLFRRQGEVGYVRVKTEAPIRLPMSQTIYGEIRGSRGQKPGENLIAVSDGGGSVEEVLLWMKGKTGIRSLFVDSYPFAIRLCHRLAAQGVRVPDDLFVGSVAERDALVPGLPIAVAVLDSRVMGRIAGEKLVSLIEGEARGVVVHDLPPCVVWPEGFGR